MNKPDSHIETQLCQGLEQLNVEFKSDQIDKLMQYLNLLSKWNKTHNLTAITDPQEMLTLHLLDSLSILSAIKGSQLLDVGSGAGLPGIIIAMFFPDIKVYSIDTRGKKIQFQTLAASSLGLSNYFPVHERVEKFQSNQLFDQIICRAFSSLENFVLWTKHLIAVDGEWLAMKGQIPESELLELKNSQNLTPDSIEKIQLPNFDGERHLLTFKA